MSFTSKNIHTNNSLSFLKWATLFFFWMSCILFVARAFEIVPVATNTVQYIKSIFLTASGDYNSTVGIRLDGWSTGGITITNLANTIVLGADSDGKLTGATSGDIYNFISGYALSGPTWATGPAWTGSTPSGVTWSVQFNDGGSLSGDSNLVWSGGSLNIGTTGMETQLQIFWISWAGFSFDTTSYGWYPLSMLSIGNSSSASWLQLFHNKVAWEYWGLINRNWPLILGIWTTWTSISFGIAISWTNVGIWTLLPEHTLHVAWDMYVAWTGIFTSNVGIGTSSPSTQLQIDGNTWTIKMHNIDWWGFEMPTILLNADVTDSTWSLRMSDTTAWSAIGNYKDPLKLFAWYTWYIWISATSGNVGIGTASPSAMLDVNWGIRPKTHTLSTNSCITSDYPQWTIYYSSYYDTMCYCASWSVAKTMTWADCYAFLGD